jgi:UDP-2-acetamido-3-amino-2,3-dideoxy-glucuronate N-acetyltransferase
MIHPFAVVHSDCNVGDGTLIWQFASVIRGATLGKGCNIASCAIIDGARLGDFCSVGHGASIHPGARLSANVFVGPGAVICNDLWPSTSKAGFDLGDVPTVIIEDGASIGANAVVLPGVRVGAEAVIAAHATVSRDVPPGMVAGRDGDIYPKPADWRERRTRFAA